MARAGLFAMVAVVLAAAAHLVAGGRAPTAGLVVVLSVPVAAVAVVLTARRRSTVVIASTLGVVQFALHHALMVFTAPASGATACLAGVAPAPVHAHHGVAPVAQCAGGAAVDGAMTATTASDVASGAYTSGAQFAMVVAHLGATVLTALLLAHADRVVSLLLCAICPRVVAPQPIVVVARGVIAVLRCLFVTTPEVAVGAVCLRGPPAGGLLAA